MTVSATRGMFLFPDEYVFKNAELKIKKGEHYDLIGRSGCGKSTIFKILLRFYEPDTDSTIRINGESIKDYGLKSLRNQFGFVSQ